MKKQENNSIGNLLIQVCKHRRNTSNTLLSEAGIYSGQDALLYYLSLEDGQTITSLVEKLCIQHATISNMIDRMAANSMVTKEKDSQDKRTSRVYLTDSGRLALKQVTKVWNIMEQQTVRGMSEKEIETLSLLLKKVLHNLT